MQILFQIAEAGLWRVDVDQPPRTVQQRRTERVHLPVFLTDKLRFRVRKRAVSPALRAGGRFRFEPERVSVRASQRHGSACAGGKARGHLL